MFKKRFYTLWKGNANGEGEAILLEDEPFFKTRRNAFKRASELANKLAAGWDQVILVRRITLGSLNCEEWVFEKAEGAALA